MLNNFTGQAKGQANDAANKQTGGMGQKAQDAYHEARNMAQGGDKKGAMNFLKEGFGKIMGGGKWSNFYCIISLYKM